MVGTMTRLRGWEKSDAEWYVQARDEVVFEFTTESRGLTVSETSDAIRRARDDDSLAAFAITDADGSLVGNLAVSFTETEAEISYFLAPGGRGRGIATEAVGLASSWALKRGATRVVANVAVANEASAAVLRRTGFTSTGAAWHRTLGAVTVWTLIPLDVVPVPRST